MDILGTIQKKPNQKNGKWDYLHIEFESNDEFNEATSKIMNILYKKNAEGKCFVKDVKGAKYDLDIIHATFNVEENRISVYPYSCRMIPNPSEQKNKNITNTNNNKKSEK
jgi:hypothetical protein